MNAVNYTYGISRFSVINTLWFNVI